MLVLLCSDRELVSSFPQIFSFFLLFGIRYFFFPANSVMPHSFHTIFNLFSFSQNFPQFWLWHDAQFTYFPHLPLRSFAYGNPPQHTKFYSVYLFLGLTWFLSFLSLPYTVGYPPCLQGMCLLSCSLPSGLGALHYDISCRMNSHFFSFFLSVLLLWTLRKSSVMCTFAC